jgi:hypothetical protein
MGNFPASKARRWKSTDRTCCKGPYKASPSCRSRSCRSRSSSPPGKSCSSCRPAPSRKAATSDCRVGRMDNPSLHMRWPRSGYCPSPHQKDPWGSRPTLSRRKPRPTRAATLRSPHLADLAARQSRAFDSIMPHAPGWARTQGLAPFGKGNGPTCRPGIRPGSARAALLETSGFSQPLRLDAPGLISRYRFGGSSIGTPLI